MIADGKGGWAWKGREQLQRIRGSLTSSGSLEDRLRRAGTEIGILKPDMVPPEHQGTVVAIKRRLSEGKPRGNEGSYAAAIAEMSENERDRMAEQLSELWALCEAAHAEP